jgi:hypothetical protein
MSMKYKQEHAAIVAVLSKLEEAADKVEEATQKAHLLSALDEIEIAAEELFEIVSTLRDRL